MSAWNDTKLPGRGFDSLDVGRSRTSPGVAKLNDAQVLAIRRLHLDGVPQMDLCRAFGVTSGNVHNIVAGKLWRHLPLIPPATRGAP